MAKFVCDYGKVNDISGKLNTLADNFATAVTNYQSKVESGVSGWNGEAKSKFLESNNKKVQELREDVKMVNDLSDFIKQASQAIESTDSELSGMQI